MSKVFLLCAALVLGACATGDSGPNVGSVAEALTTDCRTFTNSTTSVPFAPLVWGPNQQTNGNVNMGRSVAMLYPGTFICDPDVVDVAPFTPLSSYVFCLSDLPGQNLYVNNFTYTDSPPVVTSTAYGDVYLTSDSGPTGGELIGTTEYNYGGQVHITHLINGQVWRNSISAIGISAKNCRQ